MPSLTATSSLSTSHCSASAAPSGASAPGGFRPLSGPLRRPFRLPPGSPKPLSFQHLGKQGKYNPGH